MKSKKSSLRAVLFLALIGAAFAFTACWQGTPAGGSDIPGGGGGGSAGGNTASSIEGITWKSENSLTKTSMTLVLRGGRVKFTGSINGSQISDNGKYKITDDTITFTGFTNAALQVILNKAFGYQVEGDTFTLLDKSTGAKAFQFKKEKK